MIYSKKHHKKLKPGQLKIKNNPIAILKTNKLKLLVPSQKKENVFFNSVLHFIHNLGSVVFKRTINYFLATIKQLHCSYRYEKYSLFLITVILFGAAAGVLH